MNDKLMVGLIGGSGLGDALAAEKGRAVFDDTPFGKPSGPITVGRWAGVRVAILSRHGAGHVYNPSTVPYRANIHALKQLGVTHLIASGAVGSLREQIAPRDLVIPDQIIDKTHQRRSTFFDTDVVAHVEFAEPFCPGLRRLLVEAGTAVETTVHDGGTYVCMEGPQFSTVAESKMHQAWGGDLIGMTCCPEAKLAREAEICYALVALPTDYDCWRPHDPDRGKQELLAEIIGHLEAATANAVALIKAAVERIGEGAELAPCGCGSALELAIWSDRERIPARTVERLGPLLSKYVGPQSHASK